jgi:hypothetical protein
MGGMYMSATVQFHPKKGHMFLYSQQRSCNVLQIIESPSPSRNSMSKEILMAIDKIILLGEIYSHNIAKHFIVLAMIFI